MSFVLSVLPLSTMTSFHPPWGESSLQYAFKTSGIVRAPLKVAIRTVSIRSCTHSQAVSTTNEGFQLHQAISPEGEPGGENESHVQSSSLALPILPGHILSNGFETTSGAKMIPPFAWARPPEASSTYSSLTLAF